MYSTYSTRTTDEWIALLAEQQALIKRLSWHTTLNMLTSAGLHEAIRTLPEGRYTIVFADIDRLRDINRVTGNHLRSNRYLAAGLKVRDGEIAGQLLGDEFIFILAENGPSGRRRRGHSANAFVARIARQLAGQPLLQSERYALAAAHGCHVSQARLSATFSTMSGVRAHDVMQAIEWLSGDVLRLKAERDEVMV